MRKMPILLAVTVILSGCATHGDQRRAEGAAAGAAAGALVGVLLGDDQKSAMIGAIVGGILGGVAGDLVAKRQQGYATREAAIQTETQIVKRQTENIHAQNQQLAQDIRNYEQQIQNLRRYNASLQDQKKIVADRHQEALSLLRLVENELVNTNTQYQKKYQHNQVSDSDVSKWKTQVANLEKEKKALQKNVDTLFSMSQSL